MQIDDLLPEERALLDQAVASFSVIHHHTPEEDAPLTEAQMQNSMLNSERLLDTLQARLLARGITVDHDTDLIPWMEELSDASWDEKVLGEMQDDIPDDHVFDDGTTGADFHRDLRRAFGR